MHCKNPATANVKLATATTAITINQYYFTVHTKVDQRASQLSLLDIGITKT